MTQKYEAFGKYILLEKLATGGMAEVFLARSNSAGGIGKFVAIKRILPQYSDNEDFIQMFKGEAKIAINLSHSNIVSIQEFGMDNGQLFLVMDYVEGRNLRQILNKLKSLGKTFSIDQTSYIIKEVAAGLDHAHRSLNGATGKPLNITHRDISPQNIMVNFEGEVKIVDFGIAKAETQAELTRTGTLKGKFGYMSPEQAEGGGTDLRTDIFSLGIVLWELLANERLFTAKNEMAVLRKIRDCQIPNLRKINPNIEPELERITMKALARDRNLRYQTAGALYRDLNRFLNRHYPDFSTQDFSVFIKSHYSSEVLENRRRLIEYSKVTGESPTHEPTVLMAPKAKKPTPAKDSFPEPLTTPTLTKSATVAHTVPPKDEDDSRHEITVFSEPGDATVINTTEQENKSAEADTLDEATPTGSESAPFLILDQQALERAAGRILHEETVSSTKNAPLKTFGKSAFPEAEFTAITRTGALSANRRKKRRSARSFFGGRPVSVTAVVLIITIVIASYASLTRYFQPTMQPVIQFVDPLLPGWARLLLHPRPEGVAAPAASDETQRLDVSSVSPVPPAPESMPTPFEPSAPVPPTAPGSASFRPLRLNSNPSGAEVWINGQAQPGTTPGVFSVPSQGRFRLELRLENFEPYVDPKFSLALAPTGQITVPLAREQVAYVNLDVRPPSNVKIFVNGKLLEDAILPIKQLSIPPNKNVVIEAIGPKGQASAVVRLPVNQTKQITLYLKAKKGSDSRLPADAQGE